MGGGAGTVGRTYEFGTRGKIMAVKQRIGFIPVGASCRRSGARLRSAHVCCNAAGAAGGSSAQKETPKLGMVLVVADLKAMGAVDSAMVEFFERLTTHRKAKQKCYLSVVSEKPWDYVYNAIIANKFPQLPDCLITSGGVEFYQRGYDTPDPYYADLSTKGWDPNPTRWIMGEFFGDYVGDAMEEDKSTLSLTYPLKDKSSDLTALQDTVAQKMKEMGVRNKVVVDGANSQLRLVPAGAGYTEAVSFLQEMLKAEKDQTILFGLAGSPFPDPSLQKSGDLIILSGAKKQSNDSKIYTSSKMGAEALIDGLRYHAIL